MSITINHVLSNRDMSRQIFSEFDSRTLSKCSSVCKLFNKIIADNGVQLNDILQLEDFFLAVFSKLDAEMVIRCSLVCNLWNSKISRDDVLQKLIPEVSVLCNKNIKECINKYAVGSLDEMTERFKKFIEKTQPFEFFLFACVCPYNPDNEYCVERQPYPLPLDKDLNLEDFCILMKPINNRESILWTPTIICNSWIPALFPPYYCLQFNISGNFPCENKSPIYFETPVYEETMSIIEQHDYPYTHRIRGAWQTFKCSPSYSAARAVVIGGAVVASLAGVAALGYYGGRAFCNSSYYDTSKIKKFCDYFNYNQLDI